MQLRVRVNLERSSRDPSTFGKGRFFFIPKRKNKTFLTSFLTNLNFLFLNLYFTFQEKAILFSQKFYFKFTFSSKRKSIFISLFYHSFVPSLFIYHLVLWMLYLYFGEKKSFSINFLNIFLTTFLTIFHTLPSSISYPFHFQIKLQADKNSSFIFF